jgi:hypothetical protein
MSKTGLLLKAMHHTMGFRPTFRTLSRLLRQITTKVGLMSKMQVRSAAGAVVISTHQFLSGTD